MLINVINQKNLLAWQFLREMTIKIVYFATVFG